MARALSVTDLLNKKTKLMAFEDKWKASFGNPEHTGSWLIWGESSNGKTEFTLQLAKYLTNFGRVAFNSMEQGASESIKLAFKRQNMTEVRRKLILLDNEPMDELKERLRKHKAPNFVVIDSLQYSDMDYKEYKAIRKEFPEVLFLIISHAEGKKPEGRVANKIRYDAFVKIRVEGFTAFPMSRFGGGKPFIIWKEKAEEYHSLAEFN